MEKEGSECVVRREARLLLYYYVGRDKILYMEKDFDTAVRGDRFNQRIVISMDQLWRRLV